MAKNRRILIDTLGVSHEAFARSGSNASQNKFIWNNNIKKIEKMQLKEERQVHKTNSLKSRYSKIDFREWKLFVLSTKRHVKRADLKVRENLYSKGAITLDIFEGEVDEIYSNKSLGQAHTKFVQKTDALILKIEKAQMAITDIKFLKAKYIPEDTTRKQMVDEAKVIVKDLIAEVKGITAAYQESNINIVDGEAVDFETESKVEVFNELTKEYKSILPDLKKQAKEKAAAYTAPTKSKNVIFNLRTNIKNDAYKLELAKLEVSHLTKLAEYDWEAKFNLDIANEIIETMPTVISAKVDNSKKLFKAFEKVQNAEKDLQKAKEIKEKISIAKKEAKESIKNEAAKLKMSGAAKGGLKTKKSEIKHNLKSKIRQIKLTDKTFSNKADYSFLLADLSQKISYENKIFHSNVQEIRRKTPVEISLAKYWISIIAAVICPGIDSLINKQWTKGALKLIGTAFFILILFWCFGAFPSAKGNGLIGLGTFGAVNGQLVNGNDSRFYLVTGTIAIIFIAAAFMYWLISILNAINVANLARAGVRYSNWRDQKRLLKTAGLPYLLSTPALIFILFIVVLPLLATLLLSFTNFNQRVYIPATDKHIILNGVTHPFAWVGGQQYDYITRVVGDDFTKVLLWTVIWTVFATFLTMFLGTFLAILVNQNRIKGKTFFRVIYILPWAIPAFLTILFFSIFFAKSGVFNEAIGSKIFGRSVDWKNEVNYQKALLIFIQGWLGQSYMFLLVTGMIQSIPKSLYEAARVDGSKPMQQFNTITMPIVIMQIAPLLIGQFTFNFNNFGIIYLFNGGGPKLSGSAGETDIFLSWVYRLVNNGVFAKPGAGAALSLIVSIFVVTPSAFLFFRSKSFRGGNF